MSRVKRAEVWSNWPCAGGVFLGNLRALVDVRRQFTVRDGRTASIDILKLGPDRAIVKGQRVIRFLFDGADATEHWRVKHIRDPKGLKATVTTVELAPPEDDLIDATILRHVTSGGGVHFDEGLVESTLQEYLEDELIPLLVANGHTWWDIGEIGTELEDILLTFDWLWSTPRAFNQGLLDAFAELGHTSEFFVSADGEDGFLFNYVRAIGAGVADRDVSYGRQISAGDRVLDHTTQATRVYVRGDDDAAGVAATIAEMVMRVTATNASPAWIEVEDPEGGGTLITRDDQFNDLYVAKDRATFDSVLISDTIAASQRLMVANITNITVGDLVSLRRTSGENGEEIASIVSPADVTEWGDRSRIVRSAGMHGMRTWAKNGNADVWLAGDSTVPTGWSLLGGDGNTTVSKNTDPQFIQHGPFSIKLTQATATFTGPTGLRLPFTIHRRPDKGLISVIFRVYSSGNFGSNHFEMNVGSHQFLSPDDLPAGWYNICIPGIDANVEGTNSYNADLRMTPVFSGTAGAPNSIYFDSCVVVMRLLQTPPWIHYSDANKGVHVANRALDQWAPPVVEYSTELRDFELLDAQKWPHERLLLGSHLRVRDPEVSGTPVRSRIVGLEPGYGKRGTVVQLSSRPAELTEII